MNRREVMQMLVALGAAAPGLADAAAQAPAMTAAELEAASALLARRVPERDAAAIRRALARNLENLQPLRDLEIDDAVVPAVTFRPRRS